jgi:hypothetical protein
MRTRILTITGMLLVAVSTSQMETAAARNPRKMTRAHPAAQQLRVGVGPRPEGRGMSAPTASDNRSCDIFWCYHD